MQLRCLFLTFVYLALVSAGGGGRDDDDDAEWQSNGNWWNGPGKTPAPKPTWKVISNNVAVLQNSCLWPPTHKYVYFHELSTTDKYIKSVDPACPILTRKVLSCSSNQPDNGFGDGNTVQDCVYVPKNDAVCVRAERQGLVRGDRIYTIKFELTSKCWSGPKQFNWQISVPHGTGWGNGWDWDKGYFNNKCTSPITNPGKAIVCDPNLLPPPTEPRCPQMDCSDNNDCTADFCVEATGTCTHTTISCDDGNACTKDTCSIVGGCKHTKVNCDDNNCCTEDSCSPTTGCVHTPSLPPSTDKCQVAACDGKKGWKVSPSKVNCDDNDVCTIDTCDPKLGCQNKRRTDPPSSTKCEVVTCDSKKGWQKSPKVCDDGDKCTTDSCDAATGNCVYTRKNCDDKSICTSDSCVAATGECFHEEVNKPTANFCQMVVCDPTNGWSVVEKNMDCNDGDICTVDSCDVATGNCLHLPISPSVPHTKCEIVGCNNPGGIVVTPLDCSDDDVCTNDSCSLDSGDCVNEPIVCGADNLCLMSSCDPVMGCVSQAKDCNDNNPCTVDSCDIDTGCVYKPTPLPETTDLCRPWSCDAVAGIRQTDLICPDDGLACTDNVCVAGTCTYPTKDCSDNDACTINSCDESKGGCVVTPLVCKDDNVCDSDYCRSDVGCVHEPLSPLPVGECLVNQCRDSAEGWKTVPNSKCPEVFKCSVTEPPTSDCKVNRTAFLTQNLNTMKDIARTTLGSVTTGGVTVDVYFPNTMAVAEAPDNSGQQYVFQVFIGPAPGTFDTNGVAAKKFLEKVAMLMGYHPDDASKYLQLVVTPASGSAQRLNVRINLLFGTPAKKRTFVDTLEANIPESLSASPSSVGFLGLAVVGVGFVVYVVKQRQ